MGFFPNLHWVGGNRIKDEYGSEWLESIAMTPQGIQPGSEEKRKCARADPPVP